MVALQVDVGEPDSVEPAVVVHSDVHQDLVVGAGDAVADEFGSQGPEPGGAGHVGNAVDRRDDVPYEEPRSARTFGLLSKEGRTSLAPTAEQVLRQGGPVPRT